MNKIRVVNDIVDLCEVDDSITLDYVMRDDFFDVSTINIIVSKSTSLDIDYVGADTSKLNICIKLLDNVILDLTEVRTGVRNKVKYTYIVGTNSKLNISKVYSVDGMRELDIIDLNGEGAIFNYNFKTVCINPEKYDMVINHNAKKTISYINNGGLNKENGSLIFNITSIVPSSLTGCIVEEKNRIITLNNNECKISPNLLIDEFDTIANHSAYVGGFKDSQLFYLRSRGISLEDAKKLLIKGFLLSELKESEKINKILEKHWRWKKWTDMTLRY